MATLNPRCTPGWVEPDPTRDGYHMACCGCGWRKHGVSSRTRAKNAQRRHRFPPPKAQPLDPDFSHPPATEGPSHDQW